MVAAVTHEALVARYTARLVKWTEVQETLSRLDTRASTARVCLVALVFSGALWSWWTTADTWPWLLPLCAFILVAVWHERIATRRLGADGAVDHFTKAIDRIEGRWQGRGNTGEHLRPWDHAYANDLDLFGSGSMFELLWTGRMPRGEAVLANWLLSPGPIDDIRERQQAVSELSRMPQLLEDVAVASASGRASGPRSDAPPALAPVHLAGRNTRLRVVTYILSAGVLAASLTLLSTGSAVWLEAVLVLQFVSRYFTQHAIDGTIRIGRDSGMVLGTLRVLLTVIESTPFKSTRLRALRRQVEARTRASEAIDRLLRLVEAHEWGHGVALVPFGFLLYGVLGQPIGFTLALLSGAALLLFSPALALAVDGWTRRHGPSVAAWLDVAAEFEALLSLATYHSEHPINSFPELLDASPSAPGRFEGQHLTHPLLPAALAVANDIVLNTDQRLVMISGSNMSGKSTLLRTVGANAVLALAGTSVSASRLRISHLHIGATLRIHDSLADGRSRFYSEIDRIRRIARLTDDGRAPTLFLFDELFHGTNSEDRLEGGGAILRFFLARHAVGLATTHDLRLAALSDALGGHATSMHFQDSGGTDLLTFDYRLKPGRVTRSNALALLAAIGPEFVAFLRPHQVNQPDDSTHTSPLQCPGH